MNAMVQSSVSFLHLRLQIAHDNNEKGRTSCVLFACVISSRPFSILNFPLLQPQNQNLQIKHNAAHRTDQDKHDRMQLFELPDTERQHEENNYRRNIDDRAETCDA